MTSPLHYPRNLNYHIFIEKEAKLKGIKEKEIVLIEELKAYSELVDKLFQNDKEALLEIALSRDIKLSEQ